jgi:hypothetical protein
MMTIGQENWLRIWASNSIATGSGVKWPRAGRGRLSLACHADRPGFPEQYMQLREYVAVWRVLGRYTHHLTSSLWYADFIQKNAIRSTPTFNLDPHSGPQQLAELFVNEANTVMRSRQILKPHLWAAFPVAVTARIFYNELQGRCLTRDEGAKHGESGHWHIISACSQKDG